jgi:hypothetical protein
MKMAENHSYETSLKLAYDEEEHGWKVGPYKATIVMAPVFAVNGSHNINGLTVTVVNKGHSDSQKNFMMGFDSVGHREDGKPVLYTKFEDACEQLEKNKKNLERYLHATVDISVLGDQKTMALEFEKRAAGQSLGNNRLVFD